MSLVDDVRIKIKAGNGGKGSNAPYSQGGNGGRGGSIYFQASANVSDLSEFRYRKEFKAENGTDGKGKNLYGKKGRDLPITVPLGTKLIYEATGEFTELLTEDYAILVAKGGQGGIGNAYADDPKNDNREGESYDLHLILSLIADIGLIGLPNAGKSSLLAVLTSATPKIGNYPFTTLEPNLGVYGKTIIADIPGLIEGASIGKGLGIQFLKHIEKTKILMHCIDSTDANVTTAYQTVRTEFQEYNKTLLDKEEIILLTKKDLVSEKQVKKQIKSLKQFKRRVIPLSIYDEKSLDNLTEILKSI